jgi:hypothetical protein
VRDETYHGYPKENTITVIAYVSKKEYEAKVVRELNRMVDRPAKYAKEGSKAQKAGMLALAMQNYVKGKQHLDRLLKGLPVQRDVDGDGKADELGAFFDTKMMSIIHGLKVAPLDDTVMFDVEGRVRKKPVVYARFEKKGKKSRMPDIPIKMSWAKGDGTITVEKLKTGRLGDVMIPVEYVDPANPEAVLQVEIDLATLCPTCDLAQPPSCLVTFKKTRAVAYSVVFSYGGKRVVPRSLAEEVKALLVDYGFGAVAFTPGGKGASRANLEKVAALNVDYWMLVQVSGKGGKLDYMYSSRVSSKVSCYSLPGGDMVFSEVGPSAEEYGTNLSGAGYNALGKIKKKMLAKLENRVKALRLR